MQQFCSIKCSVNCIDQPHQFSVDSTLFPIDFFLFLFSQKKIFFFRFLNFFIFNQRIWKDKKNMKINKTKKFFYRYFSADGRYEITIMTKAIVYSTGLVVWQPPAVYKSSCSINVEYFPYDVQTCVLKLGSWTYDGFKAIHTFFLKVH